MRITGRTTNDILSGGVDSCEQASLRITQKHGRYRRGRNEKGLLRTSLPSIAVFCFILGLAVTVCTFYFNSTNKEIDWRLRGEHFPEEKEMSHEMHSDYWDFVKSADSSRELWSAPGSDIGRRDDIRKDGEYGGERMDVSASFDLDEHSRRGDATVSKLLDVRELKRFYHEADRNELKKSVDKYTVSLDSAQMSGKQGTGIDVNLKNDSENNLNTEDYVLKTNKEQAQSDHFIRDGRIRKSLQPKELGNDKIISADPFGKVNSVVSLKASIDNKYSEGGHEAVFSGKSSSMKIKSITKGKRHHSCEIKLLDASKVLEPLKSRNFSSFSLQYTETEKRPDGVLDWEPWFAGHQSLQEREQSFFVEDTKNVNCGFINGSERSQSTGFDLVDDDVKFMNSCQVAVSSCIFGNSDNLRTPYVKKATYLSRNKVCFVMFMDENTLQTLWDEGQKPDSRGFIGLWKIVIVRNLPYSDMRRVGKIPKFLSHRLFPSARYSIWLDSKLRLQSDPLQILEYFLWRKSHEYAISDHYDRHCVWEEVLQNKKLNKFNHTIIDQQLKFYQNDGLKRFDPTDQNRLLPSNVPEGSLIIRAHTPMSNLFSCLWFNEIDRFTPRDQLSFAYTYLKLRRANPKNPFYLNMFKDCERRSIAKLFRHRGEEVMSIIHNPRQAVA